jgi:hypothetical protein
MVSVLFSGKKKNGHQFSHIFGEKKELTPICPPIFPKAAEEARERTAGENESKEDKKKKEPKGTYSWDPQAVNDLINYMVANGYNAAGYTGIGTGQPNPPDGTCPVDPSLPGS